jgi:hypothetical protein
VVRPTYPAPTTAIRRTNIAAVHLPFVDTAISPLTRSSLTQGKVPEESRSAPTPRTTNEH